MIGKLKGVVDATNDDFMILDVGGVGYKVFTSKKTLQNIPAPGETCELLIETHMREDQIRLYGFLMEDEQEIFNLLLNVQGVGARLALAVLSAFTSRDVVSMLSAEDTVALARAQGVGPKLASRIINELKTKIAGLKQTKPSVRLGVKNGKEEQAFRDALSALVNLGYKPTQAHLALLNALRKSDHAVDVETLVRAGLRELAT